MAFDPTLRPVAAALAGAAPTARRSAAAPVRTLGKLLPLGAMLTGMTLATEPALAQAPPGPAQGETTLPTVDVRDAREGGGYRGDVTEIGRMPQAPRDVPQSLTVIPEQLMQDRGNATLQEALQNAVGITFAAGEGGRIGDNFALRGFSINGDLYLDGIRDVAQYTRDVFNLEQIDVLRGAASMIFGRGSTGGVVNQVSKQPYVIDQYSAALTYGSFDYKRGTADLNKVVGENAAVRLNAMWTDSDSFRGDGPKYERWGVAPAFRWGIGTQTEVALSYYYLNVDNVPDFGVPWYQGRPLDVPVDRSFYGFANGAFEKYETGIATGSLTYRFSPTTWIRTVLRRGDYERDLWSSVPRLAGNPPFITDSTLINRQRQARGGDETILVSQTDFVSTFGALGMKHQVLAGVELAREEAERWGYAPTGTIPQVRVGYPDPFPVLPANFFNKVRVGEVNYKGNTIGIYGQDMIEFVPNWTLLLGLRWDQLDADYERAAPLGPLSRLDRVWSYRTGLLWQPSLAQTYYIAYGTAFNPSAELYSLDLRGSNTPPEESRNMEVGAKWDLLENNLSLRTAIYRTEKTNERNTDPLVADQFLLSGRRHTDGIELEGAGRIARNWELYGGVGWMWAKIDESINRNEVGHWPLNTPPYTANLWTTYRLPYGWRIGGGFYAAGGRYGNNANTVYAPGYIRWDAMVAYEQPHYAFRLNFFNLFDTVYYDTVYQGHVIPGSPRAVQATLELKF